MERSLKGERENIDKFSIIFPNQNEAEHFTGTRLSGFVELTLGRPADIRELIVRLHGDGHCYWEEEEYGDVHTSQRDGTTINIGPLTIRHSSRHSGNRDDRIVRQYEGNEKYCNITQSLYGTMLHAGTGRVSHPEGRYTYPFFFDLPNDLPSSFEGKNGYIRYVIEAEIFLPRNVTPKVEKNILIKQRIDTNLARYLSGLGGEEEKTVCCMCCVLGNVVVRAHIDRICYCSGETIYVNATAENHTSKNMGHVVAKLYQNLTYKLRDKTKKERKKVHQVRGDKVVLEDSIKWENREFIVPSIPPTIVGFGIITLEYELEFQLEIPCGINAKIKLPIVIGTVPFDPFPQSTHAQPTEELHHSRSLATSPPPSYLEAMSDQSNQGQRQRQHRQPTAPPFIQLAMSAK